jgi:hypothetical protein
MDRPNNPSSGAHSIGVEIGGSIPIMARSWNKWFSTMSRNAPVFQKRPRTSTPTVSAAVICVVDMVAVYSGSKCHWRSQHQDVLDRFLAGDRSGRSDLRTAPPRICASRPWPMPDVPKKASR